ncbi:hypothetical protein ACWEQ7_34045 [Streptomyces sp. NPDC004069]
MRNSIRAGAVTTVAAMLPLFGASSAFAAEAGAESPAVSYSCPSNGYVTNWDVCSKLDNGHLQLDETSNGNYISVWYHKTGGTSFT